MATPARRPSGHGSRLLGAHRPVRGNLDVLRTASEVDDETWIRARAWAFVGPGLLTIAGYRHTMPSRTDRLISMVEVVAADVGIQLR
jgi:hypothetical protein